MEELIDVLDEQGNKTGEILPKSEIKKRGLYHRAIAVCIVNANHEILMQKRSTQKKVYPDLWSIFVKGHIASGESSLKACQREIKEELGIDITPNELQYLYTIFEEKITSADFIERIFFDTFLLKKEINVSKIHIQKEELSEVKLVPAEKVKALLQEKEEVLVPNRNDYEKIFMFIQ